MLRIRLSLVALLLVSAPAYAGIDAAGTTSGNFLSIGTGAAALSMGGAVLGAGHDLAASAWNPAALADVTGPQFSLSHAALAQQQSQDWLAAGGRIGRGTTHWSASALYQNDGSFDGRDASGNPTSSFNVSNLALGAHVARPFGDHVSMGAGLKWASEYLGETSGSALAFDAGLQARAGAFGFGAAARNVGGKMKYASGSYDLPSVFGVGASYTHEKSGLTLALDANFPKAYYQDVRVGAQWMWQDRVALRGGYRLELGASSDQPVGGPSFGLGAGANGLWFDYAFLAGTADAQGQHRLSLAFHPGFMNHGLANATPANVAPANAAPVAAREPAVAPKPAAKRETPKPAENPAPVAAAAPQAVPTRVATPAPAPPVAATPAPIAPGPVAPRVTLPDDALAADVAPRPVKPANAVLAPGKLARTNKLVIPVVAAEPAPAPAPVAAAAPAPVKKAAKKSAPVTLAPVAATPAPAPTPVAAAVPVPSPAPSVTPPPAAEQPEPVAEVASSRPGIEVVVVRHDPPVPNKPQPRPESVVLKAGETLQDLAKRYGTSVAAIMMENNLVKDNAKPGQKIKLPKN